MEGNEGGGGQMGMAGRLGAGASGGSCWRLYAMIGVSFCTSAALALACVCIGRVHGFGDVLLLKREERRGDATVCLWVQGAAHVRKQE